jgi:probable rRNA maturation factor
LITPIKTKVKAVKSQEAFLIEIQDFCAKSPVSLSCLKRFIQKILKKEKIKSASLSFFLVSNPFIRRLNKKFLKLDRATDVLAFDLKSEMISKHRLMGDVVISLDAALSSSQILGVSFKEELYRYIVHGILHLAGYDDRAASKKKKMWKRQEYLVKKYRYK